MLGAHIRCNLFDLTLSFVQKNAVAVAYCKRGKGEMRLNGSPLELVQPDTLRWKVLEPVLLLGKQRFSNVDIRIRVKGGGRVSQIYAIRQSIAKALVAFYQKCEWAMPWLGACRRQCSALTRWRWILFGCSRG